MIKKTKPDLRFYLSSYITHLKLKQTVLLEELHINKVNNSQIIANTQLAIELMQAIQADLEEILEESKL